MLFADFAQCALTLLCFQPSRNLHSQAPPSQETSTPKHLHSQALWSQNSFISKSSLQNLLQIPTKNLPKRASKRKTSKSPRPPTLSKKLPKELLGKTNQRIFFKACQTEDKEHTAENAPTVYRARPQATSLPKTPLPKQTIIEMLPQAPPAKTHKKSPLLQEGVTQNLHSSPPQYLRESC